jgi:hypothetical protein
MDDAGRVSDLWQLSRKGSEGMRILVCGGREFRDVEKMNKVLSQVCSWATDRANLVIIHGGCRGADEMAGVWGRENSVKVVEVPAQWDLHGNAAGPLRNQHMIDHFTPTQGVVFPGGRGTLDMLTRLFHAGINTWVVRV